MTLISIQKQHGILGPDVEKQCNSIVGICVVQRKCNPNPGVSSRVKTEEESRDRTIGEQKWRPGISRRVKWQVGFGRDVFGVDEGWEMCDWHFYSSIGSHRWEYPGAVHIVSVRGQSGVRNH